MNRATTEHLALLFLEAKWLYNFIISQGSPAWLDYKEVQEVPVRVKDHFETRRIAHLSSQMRQSIITRTLDNMRGLAHLKANGHKTGRVRFKSEVRSIPLKQYGNTYRILDGKRVGIQGIKQRLRVRGLRQLPHGVDLANGTLMRRGGDYYLSLTTYEGRESLETGDLCLGIDFGLDKQITLSNGIEVQYSIPVDERFRRLHRRLSRQKPHGKNSEKTRMRLDRMYSMSSNMKRDIRNKIVSHLGDVYGVVCYQDENLKAWQRIWGRKMLCTSIGGIISTLQRKVRTPVEVDRFYPSTKTCSFCGSIKEVSLGERVYACRRCGAVIGRDLNSSINMRGEGLRRIGMVRAESTPAETEAATLASLEYLNSIPRVRASLVHEPGSQPPSRSW
ncbi:MAG: transposase [Promethearchaeati archaeon SRVP18_Atabeyarchaeia-1]